MVALVLATVAETETRIAAIITGFVAIIAAVGGVLMTLRKVRDREHDAGEKQIARMDTYLAQERDQRIQVEAELFQANLILVQHGIEPPPRAPPIKIEHTHSDESDDDSDEDLP